MPKGYYIRTKSLIPLKERFEAKFIPEPNTGCWLWFGATTYNGYGRISLGLSEKHRLTGSHQASWMIYKGNIPKGFHVLHSCDTPCCVNPYHLWLGTRTDNMQDCIKKGRFNLGEKSSQSKLTNTEVTKIRNDKRLGTIIAKEYKVSTALISTIRHNKKRKYG